MQFIWMIEDETPLTRPAVEVGLRNLAARLGAVVPEDAVILLQETGTLGGYPLAQAFGADGSAVWMADYRQVAQALFTVSDATLKKAGLDPSEPTFERQARRLIKRRFPHWGDSQVADLMAILPRLQNLAFALEDGGDFEDPEIGG